jgi:lysozyme
MIPGIDVSNWQENIDWGEVANFGVQFAICKASEGTTYLDPYFRRNWDHMANAGIARGAYHFAQPDLSTPQHEAKFFRNAVSAAGGLVTGDVLVLDMEAGTGNLHDWTLDFLVDMEDNLGFLPILYSGAWFLEPHGLTHSEDLSTYGLWLASYGTLPIVPPNWDFWALWQYTCEGRVPGVNGPCDCNVFNGDINQFKKYGAL